MKINVWCFVCCLSIVQSDFGLDKNAAALPNFDSEKSAKSAGGFSKVLFQGMTETGVSLNTFLCGDTVETATKHSHTNVEASDCDIQPILSAIGYDISGGRTLQFFNNFTYWLKQKDQKEQYYRINDNLHGNDLTNKMNSDGWVSMGALCIVVSTNKTLQDLVYQSIQAGPGEIKVVVQLWYNGDSLIQLWSQDVAILKANQTFTIAITNDSDDRLKTTLVPSAGPAQYLAAVSKSLQPDNRHDDTYKAATSSPRMVRIVTA